MIKNQKQASITKEKLDELKKAKQEFEANEENKQDPFKYKLGVNSFNGLITDLENQLNEYESLVKGSLHFLEARSLEEIPKVLIAARLAQKMSQKDLGKIIGVQEQQIQRYEATDYETASWVRIVEVALALNIKLNLHKITLVNIQEECVFSYPTGITKEQVEQFSKKVKKEHSLMMSDN